MKKYKLLPKSDNGLYRIEALRDFYNVKKGDIGGYVETEYNLSHSDYCWVYNDAKVYGDASVFDNARVYGNARVFGDARVYGDASVHGDASVYGNASVHGDARVYGDASVFDNATVFGFAKVSDNAKVFDNATVFGFAKVFGDIQVSKTGNVLTFSNVGSENGILTAILNERDGIIYINRGCFYGNIDEFEIAVNFRYGDNKYGVEYRTLIQYIKLRLS